ncbi:tRNA (guanine(37)-N1)-methyltransferase [Hypsibius exemplaris]|uniref:tRNA (guanine(37)-N1)-methyltransferase n=1 Tax=Hypsibius exemplaris TaxID=2072580 RepID=A0A9X6NEP8_HYPEX|nr:tRNA (guanine(37)-N1)-methyltransferase [Hypsibius exemplaris]
MSSALAPPITVRGMKKLDKNAFKKEVDVPCLRLKSHLISIPDILAGLKAQTIRLAKIKAFQYLPEEPGMRIAVFDPDKVAAWEEIDAKDRLMELGVSADAFFLKTIHFSWENWTSGEILQAIIGDDGPNVAGFSTVGHIVHLNLRPEHDAFKQVVGEVILDKIPCCRSVINKTNVIDNEFRNISYEVLAGSEDLQTVVKENACTFHLDYAHVYWNPRLGREHERLTQEIPSNALMYDVFAGIGPFAVPAGKRGCTVLANDLNPVSYDYLLKNITLNKVGNRVTAYNLDGRDFIRTVVKDNMILQWKCNPNASIHIVMNLPALAEEFVDVFRGLFHGSESDVPADRNSLPTVHLYCFDKTDDPRGVPLDRLDRNIGWKMDRHAIDRHFVRQVAPSKDMIRLRFLLPWELLTAAREETLVSSTESILIREEEDISDSVIPEPDSKRRKIV